MNIKRLGTPNLYNILVEVILISNTSPQIIIIFIMYFPLFLYKVPILYYSFFTKLNQKILD